MITTILIFNQLQASLDLPRKSNTFPVMTSFLSFAIKGTYDESCQGENRYFLIYTFKIDYFVWIA